MQALWQDRVSGSVHIVFRLTVGTDVWLKQSAVFIVLCSSQNSDDFLVTPCGLV
jgi:hypothetical protein